MNNLKSMKVYEVSFGIIEKREDFINNDSKTVLGIDVEEAIFSAKEKLSRKELKSYYVQEVKLLQVLD